MYFASAGRPRELLHPLSSHYRATKHRVTVRDDVVSSLAPFLPSSRDRRRENEPLYNYQVNTMENMRRFYNCALLSSRCINYFKVRHTKIKLVQRTYIRVRNDECIYYNKELPPRICTRNIWNRKDIFMKNSQLYMKNYFST